MSVQGGPHLVLPIEIPPGVETRMRPAIALPGEIQLWLDRVLEGTVIVDLLRTVTDSGWPVTIVQTRSPAGADPRRTIFAFYELFDRGVVVTLTVSDAGTLATTRDAIVAFVRATDIDRAPREVVALAQLWEEP